MKIRALTAQEQEYFDEILQHRLDLMKKIQDTQNEVDRLRRQMWKLTNKELAKKFDITTNVVNTYVSVKGMGWKQYLWRKEQDK